jgi:hypothetical protein
LAFNFLDDTMKKIILGMLASLVVLTASTVETKAQVNLSIQIGAWNPPSEYAGTNYYFLPDVDSYYYVPTHQYVYLEGSRWVFRNSLPARYASYDIRSGYKVAVNRPRAYTYYNVDRNRYARYRGTRNVIVRDHYHTRVINNTKVINRTRYVKSKPRVVTRTKVVNHYVKAKPKVITRTRVVKSKPRVVTRTKHVNVQHKGNNGHHTGHDKH